MPETPIVYDDVEVEDADASGFVCRIGGRRAFIGKWVPTHGTTVRRRGDRGCLTLPRWFVEQQGLPLSRPLTDPELEEWLAVARLRVATAAEALERAPEDAAAQAALERAKAELASALELQTRREAGPRR